MCRKGNDTGGGSQRVDRSLPRNEDEGWLILSCEVMRGLVIGGSGGLTLLDRDLVACVYVCICELRVCVYTHMHRVGLKI